MLFRPATPGFLVTLIATILLAVVSFSVPWIKSVFFLKAHVDFGGQNGTATFGVLGFCLEIGGGHVNCTSPKIGYEFDPNALLGNKTPIKIPEVVVKWLTYALILHIVAFALAAGSAVFGLLAHVREMAMTCCSTCISGFAAAVALIAFIFDVAFFFLAKARINKVPGGSAEIGNAIWITLGAWILLFFAGCFYTFGRCCISNRSRGPRRSKSLEAPGVGSGQAEAMRLDAVKAEADRKARQKQGEVGLPAFQEYDLSKPLTAKYDEEDEPYSDHPKKQQFANSVVAGYEPRRQPSNYTNSGNGYNQGYAPPPGSSIPNAYNARTMSPPQAPAPNTYPPQQSQYPISQYNMYGQNTQPPSDPYLAAGVYGHNQYPSNGSTIDAHRQGQPTLNTQPGVGYGQELYPPAGGQTYGHHTQGTSYYSTSSHFQQPSQQQDPGAYGSESLLATSYPAGTTPGATSMGRDDYNFNSTGQSASRISTNSMANPYDPPSTSDARPRGPRSPTSPINNGSSFYKT